MCAYVVHHVDVCFLDEEYDLLLVRVHVEPCQFSQIARVNPRCHAMISRWLARRIYHWNSLIISRDTSSINSRRIEDSIFHFLDDCPIQSMFSRSLTTCDECHFRFRPRAVKYRKTLEGDRQTSRRAVFVAVSISTCGID